MGPAETGEALQSRFGDVILEVAQFRGEVTALIAVDMLREVALFCRDELGFNFMSDVSAVDWVEREPRFDVVYHITSLNDWSRFRLKARVDEWQKVPTLISVWGAANWGEREVWDLFGIQFEGHPELKRLLLPDGWNGFPLRKDYAQSQITLPRPKVDKTLE